MGKKYWNRFQNNKSNNPGPCEEFKNRIKNRKTKSGRAGKNQSVIGYRFGLPGLLVFPIQ